jgi:dihydrofolate reductase
MKQISIIVAIASNNAIGKDNKLLWHIPADMKYFKKITTGHTVIMGKNTFLSLPDGPLVNRRNIIISDDPDDHFNGCVTVNSVSEAMELCDEEVESFIIGGASVYRQFLPFATKLYVTKVNKSFVADTFFPEISSGEWTEVSRELHDDKNRYEFSFEFIVFQRKS